jgi:glycosyltransferase involved in cell wall biosynthesis
MVMTHPLVTVITPSFNQGNYIRATIESVLGQDHPQLQYIVVDGGSTDETVSILQSYSDPRLTWISEADRGQSDALNKGMKQAKGDILTYINSDDLLLPGCIQETLTYFSTVTEADIVYGDVTFINDSGKTTGNAYGAPFNQVLAVLNGQDLPQPGTFWRRRVMESIGWFDESLHYRMDYDYWLRASFGGFRLDYVPGIRAAYRLHGSSKTVSQTAKFQNDWLCILKRIYERDDLPPEVEAVREDAFAGAEWWHAKNLWLEKDYAEARPLLRRFLHDDKRGRQVFAASMLIDSTLHTPLTRLMALSYKQVTGRSIFR